MGAAKLERRQGVAGLRGNGRMEGRPWCMVVATSAVDLSTSREGVSGGGEASSIHWMSLSLP